MLSREFIERIYLFAVEVGRFIADDGNAVLMKTGLLWALEAA